MTGVAGKTDGAGAAHEKPAANDKARRTAKRHAAGLHKPEAVDRGCDSTIVVLPWRWFGNLTEQCARRGHQIMMMGQGRRIEVLALAARAAGNAACDSVLKRIVGFLQASLQVSPDLFLISRRCPIIAVEFHQLVIAKFQAKRLIFRLKETDSSSAAPASGR